MSYWPPYASAERCSRAVKREELPGETWGLFDVVIRYTSDTYNEARHKLPLALNISDLQTEEEDERPAYLKRKGRGTNRQLTTSSESEDDGPFEKQPRTSQVQSTCASHYSSRIEPQTVQCCYSSDLMQSSEGSITRQSENSAAADV
ncbi:hypothetical protein DPEC_G00043840 [Dallia pectoralis]|uniref:Uncharacterized protein n=1 Tax=Dallia pectoralis TaxID=75939 RepID=A0ACC2H977_DALPE|nr:hypothetical protein DPEC_G00043840 [Dallia pectoralis]